MIRYQAGRRVSIRRAPRGGDQKLDDIVACENALPSCGLDVARREPLHDRGDGVEDFRDDAGGGVGQGGFHCEAQRLKQIGSGRLCHARRGTPRPVIGSRGIFAG